MGPRSWAAACRGGVCPRPRASTMHSNAMAGETHRGKMRSPTRPGRKAYDSSMGDLFVGTSGYNYKDWRERFYPPRLPQREWLSYYARHFNTVEVNATFYRHFAKAVYEKWYHKTTDEFRFSIKGPRLITHVKRLDDCKDALQMFLESAAGLSEKLAVILWQFPASFKQTANQREKLAAFLSMLPRAIKQAVELRDISWFTQDAYTLLDAYQAGFVINDTTAFPTARAVTGNFVYIRFHGPEALYASSYPTEQLADWAKKIERCLTNYDVYCYFNNDVSGYAVQNAVELRHLLE